VSFPDLYVKITTNTKIVSFTVLSYKIENFCQFVLCTREERRFFLQMFQVCLEKGPISDSHAATLAFPTDTT